MSTETSTRNQKTSKNYSIGSKRAGKPAYADNRPSNKLSQQSAASLANRNGDNEVCYGVPGGPDGGKAMTGQDNAGSWQQR